LRDRKYLEGYEAWLAQKSGLPARPIPPMFTPFRLRGLTLKNRVVVSPMAMYSAKDGLVNDFHLVHLGARALGGAALVFTEMTAPSPDGRITPGCAGLYSEAHMLAYKRIVDFVHQHSDAKIGSSWGTPGPRARPRWAGRPRTSPCRKATGRCWPPHPSPTAPIIRFPAR